MEPKHNTEENQQATKEETNRKRKEQRITKTRRKQITEDNKYIPINDYFKCKCTKCSNQRIYSG